MSARVIHGDCLDVMREMAERGETVTSVVTDPPYGLEFMGRGWDHAVPGVPFWRAAYALLPPGGHLLAFGGTRTFHRLAVAIEDAGFELRDTLQWIYGTGFPKSHNLPGGYGTALKPAWEPIILARKPLAGTVAANVLAHGVGALNIDGCRVHGPPSIGGAVSGATALGQGSGWNAHANRGTDIDRSMLAGRWPANVVHDGSEEVEAAFAAFGERRSGARIDHGSRKRAGGFAMTGGNCEASSGSASRFFYCAKAGRADRAGSKHPTVKPVALKRWLVRMVTPPGGVVLDPFAGSGTTLAAALAEGCKAIGIEQAAEYVADIHARLARDAAA